MAVSSLSSSAWRRVSSVPKMLSAGAAASNICCAVRASGKVVPYGMLRHARGGRAQIRAEGSGLRQIDGVGGQGIGVAGEYEAAFHLSGREPHQLFQDAAHFLGQHQARRGSGGAGGSLGPLLTVSNSARSAARSAALGDWVASAVAASAARLRPSPGPLDTA